MPRADFAAAIGHTDGLIDGGFGAGGHSTQIRAIPPVSPLTTSTAFPRDMDDAIRTQLLAGSRGACRASVRMTGFAPNAFATATASSPIGPGPITTTLYRQRGRPAGQAYIEVSGSDDKRRFCVTHGVGTRLSVLM